MNIIESLRKYYEACAASEACASIHEDAERLAGDLVAEMQERPGTWRVEKNWHIGEYQKRMALKLDPGTYGVRMATYDFSIIEDGGGFPPLWASVEDYQHDIYLYLLHTGMRVCSGDTMKEDAV